MGETISTPTYGPVDLSTTAQNPLTITSTGEVIALGPGIDGVDGSALMPWSIVNDGLVMSYGGAGISLRDGGTVINNSAITGGTDGVVLQGAAGAITNRGSISSSAGDGVALFAGGRVSNAVGAMISGYGTLAAGVFVTGGAATITNSGSIAGPNHLGVLVAAGGSLSNAVGGAISGVDVAVFFEKVAGTVTNAGSLSSGGPNGTGIYLENAGGVTNLASGAIYGHKFGVFLEGGFSSLTNKGKISTATYDGVVLGLGGTVLNVAGATIVGASNGVYGKYRAAVDVTNYGSIGATSATGAGIDLAHGGVVTNMAKASVTGGAFGVFVTGAIGTVSNAGLLQGGKYDGVGLAAGGSVVNAASGTIVGGSNGVYVERAATGTVTNSGLIEAIAAGGAAVDLGAGGRVTNAVGATISGQDFGVFATGQAGTVTNSGTIAGYHGIALEAGGSVTNNANCAIRGAVAGVFATGAAATIINSGTILASSVAGLDIEAGGTITNKAGATISGKDFGVFLTGGSGTIVNAGTISGNSYAVKFSGSGNDLLVVDPGAVFTGGSGGGGGTNTIELAAGTGTVSGINGGSFFNFQNLTVATKGNWSLGGSNSIASLTSSGTLAIAGHLDVTSGVSAGSGAVFRLDTGSSLEVAGMLGKATPMQFLGASSLVIDNALSFGTNVGTGTYAGPLLEAFGAGDTIDLKQFAFNSVSLHYAPTTGLLQLANGAAQVASLSFQTSSMGLGSFHAVSDGATGTQLSYS